MPPSVWAVLIDDEANLGGELRKELLVSVATDEMVLQALDDLVDVLLVCDHVGQI